MERGSRFFNLVLAAVLVAGCPTSAPREHTSLSLEPGTDPGPPPRRLSMVWLHHSTGDNLLQGGLLQALKKDNIDFHDINYREAVVDGFVIGDHTDPGDWPRVFNTPRYLEVIKSWELRGEKKQHDIIMFKSCFPNSDIKNEDQLDQYKHDYANLLSTFKKHRDILFIGMSLPPLVREQTTQENAERARRWARWITTDFPRDVPNVQVFDLFNALAVLPGRYNANTLVPQFAVSRHDSHPSEEGARAMTRMFIPWFNRAIREAGLIKK